MKYRIQLNAIFDNKNANDILNYVENIKTLIYEETIYPSIPIIRKAKKNEKGNSVDSQIEYAKVDFSNIKKTHINNPSGINEFEINIDISFNIQSDYYDFLNYIETIKPNAINSDSSYIRNCRFFECMHEEIPLRRDGKYFYINFDGVKEKHPII